MPSAAPLPNCCGRAAAPRQGPRVLPPGGSSTSAPCSLSTRPESSLPSACTSAQRSAGLGSTPVSARCVELAVWRGPPEAPLRVLCAEVTCALTLIGCCGRRALACVLWRGAWPAAPGCGWISQARRAHSVQAAVAAAPCCAGCCSLPTFCRLGESGVALQCGDAGPSAGRTRPGSPDSVVCPRRLPPAPCLACGHSSHPPPAWLFSPGSVCPRALLSFLVQ